MHPPTLGFWNKDEGQRHQAIYVALKKYYRISLSYSAMKVLFHRYLQSIYSGSELNQTLHIDCFILKFNLLAKIYLTSSSYQNFLSSLKHYSLF